MRTLCYLTLVLVPTGALAGATCQGKLVQKSTGDKVAEVRCTHDGTGVGSFACKGTWLLRNVKNVETVHSGNCNVIRGQTDHLCFSDDRSGGEKIKEEVTKANVPCSPG
jgi:hypothetical protein